MTQGNVFHRGYSLNLFYSKLSYTAYIAYPELSATRRPGGPSRRPGQPARSWHVQPPREAYFGPIQGLLPFRILARSRR